MTDVSIKNARWFSLMYSLLALLMLLALLAFSYATWNNVKQQVYLSLEPHNKSLTSIVRSFFDHQESLLGELATSITVTDAPDNIMQIRLNDVLRATPQMRVLAVINAKGGIVATTGDIHTLEWLDLFDHNQPTIGRLFRPTFIGENILPMRKPIKNMKGVTLGYVVAAYRLLGNNAIWQEAEEAESKRRSMVIGADRRVYLSYPESENFWQSFVSMKAEQSFLQTLAELSKKAGLLQTSDVKYQGEQLLITASLIDAHQFYIVSGIQSSDLLIRWFDRIKFVALAVLIFLIIGLFIFRMILTRASRFEAARNIAEHNVFKLSRAIEQSPGSVIVTDEKWLIEYTNNRLNDAAGISIKLTPGQILLEQFPHTLLKDDVAAISQKLLQEGSRWYGERCAREQEQWFSYSICAMTNDSGQVSSYVIVTQDITERKRVESKLYKQANFDALTGLPNRRYANELLTKSVKAAWKKNQRIAILYMDVDNFKQVNDTYGHMLGDLMLQLVATRLKTAVASQGVACHMSGDEFLVSMVFESQHDITTLAEKIMSVMRQPVLLEEKKLFISVSIGIACYPEDSIDLPSLLKHADIALYESKNKGRRCYSFFNRELNDKNKRKIDLESELHNALLNNELLTVYQIKNSINSGEICGLEALVRWQSPRLGAVSPEEFLSAAAEIGVIDKIGEFALYEACRDLQKFQSLASQPLVMAISVSMSQLLNSDILGTVKKVIEETGINPSALELGVAESMLAQQFEEVEPVLNDLLGLGVSLNIDGFGASISSLSYLTRLPISALKIDHCFINSMVNNRSAATLTHTMIIIAHKLGLKAVAAGVENNDQLALLRIYGCDLAQGDFYTTPLNGEQMADYLKIEQGEPA